MRAAVVVPPQIPEAEWVRELEAAAAQANVDVTAHPTEAP
jgi:hypothetical protein